MIGDAVDLVIHHRVGTEVRTTTLSGVERSAAMKFAEGVGNVRGANGVVTITTGPGRAFVGGIPAQNIEFLEVREL